VEGLILGLATGAGVGSRSKGSVTADPGCVLLSPSSTWLPSPGSSQSRLGEDLLSLIVVAIVGVVWVLEEVGGLFGWMVGISLVVGVEVVATVVSILGGWNCIGWVVFAGILGLLEVVFCWLFAG